MRRPRVPLGKAAWATRRVSSGIAESNWGWSDIGGTRTQGQSDGVSRVLLGLPWILSQPQAGKGDGIRHQCQGWVWANSGSQANRVLDVPEVPVSRFDREALTRREERFVYAFEDPA